MPDTGYLILGNSFVKHRDLISKEKKLSNNIKFCKDTTGT
jgi:hypothetical protein